MVVNRSFILVSFPYNGESFEREISSRFLECISSRNDVCFTSLCKSSLCNRNKPSTLPAPLLTSIWSLGDYVLLKHPRKLFAVPSIVISRQGDGGNPPSVGGSLIPTFWQILRFSVSSPGLLLTEKFFKRFPRATKNVARLVFVNSFP